MPRPGPHTISISRLNRSGGDAVAPTNPASSPVLDASNNPLTNIAGFYIQPAGAALRSGFGKPEASVSHEIIGFRDVSAAKLGDVVTDENGKTYVVQFVSDEAGMGRAWTISVQANG